MGACVSSSTDLPPHVTEAVLADGDGNHNAYIAADEHASASRRETEELDNFEQMRLARTSGSSGGGTKSRRAGGLDDLWGPEEATLGIKRHRSTIPARTCSVGDNATVVLRGCAPTAACSMSKCGRGHAHNEDRWASRVRGDASGQAFSYFGIFDGHNGPGTAQYLADHFLDTHVLGAADVTSSASPPEQGFAKPKTKRKTKPTTGLTMMTGADSPSSAEPGTRARRRRSVRRFEKRHIKTRLRAACASADAAVLATMRVQDDAKHKAQRKLSQLDAQLDDSGAAGVFLLMAPRCDTSPAFAALGWVGDAVALLVSRSTGQVTMLNPPSTWHSMDNTREARRVKATPNSFVVHNRILASLKLTRAFGDLCAKEPDPIINAVPEVLTLQVCDDTDSSANDPANDDQCIVLGSDGLFDAFRGNIQRLGHILQDAAAKAENHVRRPDSGTQTFVSAERLTDAVLTSASTGDDVTVTVVLLGAWKADPVPEPVSAAEAVAETNSAASGADISTPVGVEANQEVEADRVVGKVHTDTVTPPDGGEEQPNASANHRTPRRSDPAAGEGEGETEPDDSMDPSPHVLGASAHVHTDNLAPSQQQWSGEEKSVMAAGGENLPPPAANVNIAAGTQDALEQEASFAAALQQLENETHGVAAGDLSLPGANAVAQVMITPVC